MVRIDQSGFNRGGSGTSPEKKWESDQGFGRTGTHEKSFNWNDPSDGLWDKLLQDNLN